MKATEKEKELMKAYYERTKESRRKQMREYWLKTKDIRNEKRKRRYHSNPILQKIKSKEFRNAHKEYYKEYGKEYWNKNHDKLSEINRLRNKEYYINRDNGVYRAKKRIWEANKIKTDIKFAIKKRLRFRIRTAIKHMIDNSNAELDDEILHINYRPIIDKLILEIPPDFKENHAKYHIDHIIPLHKFDLSDPKELAKACEPANHQWLEVDKHREKSGKELKERYRL